MSSGGHQGRITVHGHPEEHHDGRFSPFEVPFWTCKELQIQCEVFSVASLLCRPILRSIMMIAFLIYFIITVATTPVGTSHLSHVGGFVTGLFPAMMFLPHLKSQK